jgi:hypothetical protein
MRNITITLNREEIMADVVNAAHVTGRRLNMAGSEEKASDIQTPEEGVDKYIVARAMQEGLSAVRKECGRYLNMGRLCDDNALEDVTGNYVLTLDMPDRWNFGATSHLTNLANAYVRDWCIYNIFEKTNPDEAANYLTKANISLSSIKPVLEMRTSPVRRCARMLY